MTFEALAEATLRVARRDGCADAVEPTIAAWRIFIQAGLISPEEARAQCLAALRAGRGLVERVMAALEEN